METDWHWRRILIFGKTRPEVSRAHREIVCTGGVFEDTRQLVRLYPIPFRLLQNEQAFKKYQWIDAPVKKATRDYRPESYKIDYDRIKLGPVIPPIDKAWTQRARWIMNKDHIYQSVEALRESQKLRRTSIGIVRPKSIISIRSRKRPERYIHEFTQRYNLATQQLELPEAALPIMATHPLRPAEYKFEITFTCDDEHCAQPHHFSILDWEVDALFFKLKQAGNTSEEAADGVVRKLQDEVCAPDRDVHFFLGNMFQRQQIFSIGGIWWPKKTQNHQLDMFN